ncbi:MAG: hypothetical protein KDA99_00200 [Planctomycetales bacterium]|nr:hypothetical protein [Planctomycetales bacterium]
MRVPRVTDLDVDGNGRIYVSSWKGATFTYAGEEVGYVLQLTPKSTASRTIIDWSRLDEQQLMQFLTGDSHRRRLAAQRELLARPRTDNTLDKIVGIARDPGQPKEVRTAAIFAVSQKRSDSRLLISLGDDDQIKPMVLRALSEMKIEAPQAASGSLFEGTATGQPHPSILVEGFCGESLDDPQARTRLEAIRAIHRLKSRTYEPKIVERLVDDDPVVAHTAMNALVDLKWWQLCFSEWQQTVDSPGVSNLDEAIYRRTWQQIADPELVRLVLEDFSDPLCTVHRELFAALCRLHFVEGTWTGVSWGTRPDTRGPYYQPETWEASAEILPAIIRYISAVDPEQFSDAIEMLIRHRFEQPEVGTALRERAEADGRCLAGLLKWYDRDVSVDEKLKNLLERTLNENTHDSNHLAMAIRLLWRCDAPPASDVLSALDRLRQVDSGAFSETWRQLRQPNLTRKHLRLLADQLHSSDRSHQVMALSLLLGLDGGDRQSRGRRRQGDDDAKELLMEAWEGLVAAKEWVSAIELSDDRSQEPRIWQLASSEDAEVATAARELAARWGLKELTPGSGPKIKEVGADAALSQLGTEGMGVELGQRWFARLSCTNCHTVSQDEPARGPYLPNVAKTYRRDQLAESLLKPSKSLAQGFATETFSLADGRQITGFVATQSAVRLAVRDGQGKEYIFSPEEIEERTPQPTSVMPEGLVDELSIDDVNALLDYLQSLGR